MKIGIITPTYRKLDGSTYNHLKMALESVKNQTHKDYKIFLIGDDYTDKPYSVVGGNPASFYYFRFNQDIIKKLLELKWWDLDDNIINQIIPLLCSNNFDNLFETCEKLKNKK